MYNVPEKIEKKKEFSSQVNTNCIPESTFNWRQGIFLLTQWRMSLELKISHLTANFTRMCEQEGKRRDALCNKCDPFIYLFISFHFFIFRKQLFVLFKIFKGSSTFLCHDFLSEQIAHGDKIIAYLTYTPHNSS